MTDSEAEESHDDHPLKGEEMKVDTGPPGVMATITLAIPVVAVVRDTASKRMLQQWNGPGMDYAPIVARAVRNSFPAEYGEVKVVAGPAVPPQTLHDRYAGLGIAHDRTPDTTTDESAVAAAQFIARHFDAKLVHEALGKHIRGGVER